MATFIILTTEQGEALDRVIGFATAAKINPKHKALAAQRDRDVQTIMDIYCKALDVEIDCEAELFDNPPAHDGDK